MALVIDDFINWRFAEFPPIGRIPPGGRLVVTQAQGGRHSRIIRVRARAGKT
jgi:hypothetical protein